jgi:hypothetical protein
MAPDGEKSLKSQGFSGLSPNPPEIRDKAFRNHGFAFCKQNPAPGLAAPTPVTCITGVSLCSLFVLFGIRQSRQITVRRGVEPGRRNLRQEVCKPGSVPARRRWMTIHLGRSLPNVSSDQPGRRRENSACLAACRPYSVLLPVGFTVPSLLPATRCALTAPFHPYRIGIRRFAFCGTFPRVAPAGRYPAPCFRGARTFLESECADSRSSNLLTRRDHTELGRDYANPVSPVAASRPLSSSAVSLSGRPSTRFCR